MCVRCVSAVDYAPSTYKSEEQEDKLNGTILLAYFRRSDWAFLIQKQKGGQWNLGRDFAACVRYQFSAWKIILIGKIKQLNRNETVMENALAF